MHKKNTINRREFIKTSSKALIGLAASSLLFNFHCKTNEHEIKVGYLPITDATPILIAYHNNYFKDEGLIVKRPVLIRSWTTLVEAFLANRINLTHFLMPIPIWMRYKNRTPAKIIAWDHTNGSGITVRKDSSIISFADFQGKQIAVPYWFSMHNVILQLGLRKVGLKPVIKPQSEKLAGNEVNLFVLPPPEMAVALAGKKIDGYIVAEPFNALGEVKIQANILRFTGDIWKNHPCCTVVMNELFIKDNPSTTQKITNAIVRAQHWVLDNRNKTAKILSKETNGYLPVSEEVLLRVFNGYEISKYGKGNIPQAIKHPEWNLDRIGFQPFPYPSATKFIYEELKKTVVDDDNSFLQKNKTDFVVNDLVETSFVKNAINNIGGPDRFPSMNFDSPWDREEVIEV